MGLTVIPTETDYSAGRDKADVAPVPNLTNYIPAAEWNAVKKAVAEASLAVGLADGSTPGSIEADRAGLGQAVFEDDFTELDTTYRWNGSDTATGSTTPVDADEPTQPTLGLGWIGAAVINGGDATRLDTQRALVVAEHDPVFLARVELADPAKMTIEIGLAGDSAEAVLEASAANGWQSSTGSSAGGASGTGATGFTAPVAGGVYDIRISVANAVSVVYEVRRVDTGGGWETFTESTAARVPQSGEDMGVKILGTYVSAGDTTYIDRVRVTVARS